MDDLANPGWASSWWNVSYAGSLAEDYPPLNTNQSPVVRGGLTTNDSPYIQVLPADVGIIVYATNMLAGGAIHNRIHIQFSSGNLGTGFHQLDHGGCNNQYPSDRIWQQERLFSF